MNTIISGNEHHYLRLITDYLTDSFSSQLDNRLISKCGEREKLFMC
jgi:hypothetical protein